MSDRDPLAAEAARRSQGYWLLSKLFLDVPTPAGLNEVRELLGEAAGEAAQLRSAVDHAIAGPEAAAIAFTRHLCLGDHGQSEPLPFESHVREGRLPGENTEHVAALMAAAGYRDVAPQANSPDHLGSELRFMAMLCHAEYAAWQAGDAAAAQASLGVQREFLRKHLGQWAAAYCSDLAARADDGYVRAIASITASSLTGEFALIDEICHRAAAQQGAMAPAA